MEARERNHLLDGMRGIAAVMVVLFHFSAPFESTLAGSGYLAVDFFFVLSGAVMAKAYGRRLLGGWAFREFLLTRLTRLYPLFFLGAMIGLLRILGAMALHDPRAPSLGQAGIDAIFNLLLLPTPISGTSIFPLDAPAWSLSLELIVNLAFGAFLFRAGTRTMAVCMAIGFCLMMTALYQFGLLDAGRNWETLYGAVGRVMWSFPAGLLIGRMGQRTTRKSNPIALAMAAFLVVLLIPSLSGAIRVGFDAIAATIVFPLLVYFGSQINLSGRFAAAFLFIGDTSYALYAIHYPLAIPMHLALAKLHITGTSAMLIATAAVVGLAALAAKGDEIFRMRVTRMWKRPQHEPVKCR